MRDLERIITELALDAGARIMEVYRSGDLGVEAKADESPVTIADLAADRAIGAGLAAAIPEIPAVTEEAAASHLKQTRDMATRLKKTGFGFSVEGFTGGPGAAQLVEHLPLDYLKIDGALMQGIASDTELQERVGRIVQDARGHKVRTIAERVEDANTMAVLWQLGVQYMQGYQIQEPEVILSAGGD
jgi:EAL domain-containing protein (putative c-di-GMP-specific phosphodiesterase class I)